MSESSALTLSKDSADYFDECAPPLTKEETKEAVSDLLIKVPKRSDIKKYPKIVRSYIDPPYPSQEYANVSMMFYPTPVLTANNRYIYGYAKVSGAYNTDEGATEHASKLIRTVNSKNHIFTVPVGHLFPLTDDEAYAKNLKDITDDPEEDKRREDALRKQQDEDERKKKEIREREEELNKDDYDDPDTLNYYTKLRVSKMQLSDYIISGRKKLKKLERKLKEKEEEIRQKNKLHPEYEDQWIENYNNERSRAGLSKYDPNEKKNDDKEEDDE